LIIGNEELKEGRRKIMTDEATAQAETQEQPKMKIFLNEDGTERERKPLGRGRHPAGSHKDADGNLVCPHVEKAQKPAVYYITLNAEGDEVKREQKGRGRQRGNFELQDGGDYDGHWLMVQAEEAEEATEAEEAPVAQEAPAVVLEPVDEDVALETE